MFSINEFNDANQNLLNFAIESKNIEIVQYLFSLKIIDLSENQRVIFKAFDSKNIDIIKYLLSFKEIDIQGVDILNYFF